MHEDLIVSVKLRYIEPVAHQSARFRRGAQPYKPERVVKYQEAIAWKAREAMAGRSAFGGPVVLIATFFLGTRRRVDNDNLLKAASDALNGIVYIDDSQITIDLLIKYYSPNVPGLVLNVYKAHAEPGISPFVLEWEKEDG